MLYDVKSGLFAFDGKEEAELLADHLWGSPLATYKLTRLELKAMEGVRSSLPQYSEEERNKFDAEYGKRVKVVKEFEKAVESAVSGICDGVASAISEDMTKSKADITKAVLEG